MSDELALTPASPSAPATAKTLHPDTYRMLSDFWSALNAKLLSAQQKYGFENNWKTDDWEDKCRDDLRRHLDKGDPLDVAAYAAFCWARGWSTSAPSLTAPASAAGWQCAARKYNGPDTPADCDWPVCGCDPQADKVIAALDESGHLKSPHAGSAWRDGNTGASLGFVGGLLSIQRKDGSGRFVFPDDDGINPETDDETGRLLHVLKLDASELIAIRNFLNDYTSAPASADGVEVATRAFYGHDGKFTESLRVALEAGLRALTPPAASQDSGAFDMRAFAVENRARCEAPNGFNHPMSSWSLSDWMTATLGELGEAANVAKKLNRVRDGITGNSEAPEQLRSNLADEIADAFIYLDLLAQSEGIDLATAVRTKFDKTSAKIGYSK